MSDLLTTELLSVWTDPDTAMEAVGNGLGIFGERVSNPTSVLATDTRLRSTLHDVLLSLVEGGALEMRPCGGGRHAFRWREDLAVAHAPIEEKVLPPEVAPEPAPTPIPTPAVVADVPPTAAVALPEEQHWIPSQPLAQAPLLALPALSCLIVILVYLSLDHAVALFIAGALAVLGVIGLARRVPFAGAWLLGVVAAGLLLRLS